MIKLLPKLEHRLVDIRENGLQLFGVMVSASNADLMTLSKNPKVKLVEVIQNEEEKEAMPLLP